MSSIIVNVLNIKTYKIRHAGEGYVFGKTKYSYLVTIFEKSFQHLVHYRQLAAITDHVLVNNIVAYKMPAHLK